MILRVSECNAAPAPISPTVMARMDAYPLNWPGRDAHSIRNTVREVRQQMQSMSFLAVSTPTTITSHFTLVLPRHGRRQRRWDGTVWNHYRRAVKAQMLCEQCLMYFYLLRKNTPPQSTSTVYHTPSFLELISLRKLSNMMSCHPALACCAYN